MALQSPLVRISAGLVTVTCSILIALDLIGVIPDPPNERIEARIRLCETLGMRAAEAVASNDLRLVRAAFQAALASEEGVASVGLRSKAGRLLIATGDHKQLWNPDPEQRERSTHVSVPLHKAGAPWGSVEVRFAESGTAGALEAIFANPLVRILGLLGLSGFVAYWFYMRKTLRHLDPSAVVPARVQAALDVMAEGVLLLDQHERIVLANTAFGRQIGRSPASLLGVKPSTLGFTPAAGSDRQPSYPWLQAIRESETFAGVSFQYSRAEEDVRSFVVTGAPVLDGWGKAKGAIATFDDVTELERKSAQLEKALVELEKSQDEIRLQNEELQILATRDPLTGVANRRHFIDTYETHFEAARRDDRGLCCLMADIDFFKAINDNHGHAMGDEVIKRVADMLSTAVRSSDAVCRYGGEEFCIALLGADADVGARVAERMRKKIASPGFARVPVTASFGVASTGSGAGSLHELIEQADRALYAAKQAGRDRVTRWDEPPTT